MSTGLFGIYTVPWFMSVALPTADATLDQNLPKKPSRAPLSCVPQPSRALWGEEDSHKGQPLPQREKRPGQLFAVAPLAAGASRYLRSGGLPAWDQPWSSRWGTGSWS